MCVCVVHRIKSSFHKLIDFLISWNVYQRMEPKFDNTHFLGVKIFLEMYNVAISTFRSLIICAYEFITIEEV